MRLMRVLALLACLIGVLPTSTEAQIPGGNNAYNILQTGVVVQTTGTTPVVAFSFPVAELKVVFIEAFVSAVEHTFAAGAAGKVEGLFARVQGNAAQVANSRVDLITTTFTAPQPTFEFVVNNATSPPQVDVRVTGKAGMTITWWVDLKVRATK